MTSFFAEGGGEVLERELRGTTYSQVAHACFSRDGQPTHHRSVGRKVAGCPRSGVAIAGADGVVAALLEDRPGRATEAGVFAEEGSAADVQRTRVCVVAAHRGVAIEAVLSTGVSYKRSTGRGGGGITPGRYGLVTLGVGNQKKYRLIIHHELVR